MYQMDGAYDKIKRVGKDQVVMLFAQIRLKAQLNSDGKVNLIRIFFFHGKQAVKIFLWIKFKTNAAVFVIIIHMVGQAQMADSAFNCFGDHGFRGDVAVSGKRCMYMIVRYDMQENVLLCKLSVFIIKDINQNVKKITDENGYENGYG